MKCVPMVGKLALPHVTVALVVSHESWIARNVACNLELKSWSMRTRSSSQRVGSGTAAANTDCAPEPILASGIMGSRSWAFGSTEGIVLFGNGFPVLGSIGQSVGFGSIGAHWSLKFPCRFAIDGTMLSKL